MSGKKTGPVAPSDRSQNDSAPVKKPVNWWNRAQKTSIIGACTAITFGVTMCTVNGDAIYDGVSGAASNIWDSTFNFPGYGQSRVEPERWDHEKTAKIWCGTTKVQSIINNKDLQRNDVPGSITNTALTTLCDRPNQATQLTVDYLENVTAQSSYETMDIMSRAYLRGGARKDDKDVDNGEFYRMLNEVNPTTDANQELTGESEPQGSVPLDDTDAFNSRMADIGGGFLEARNPLLAAYVLQQANTHSA